MRLPRQFTFNGKTWRIKVEADLHHDDGTKCFGLCDLDLRVIYLDAKLKGKKRDSILFHELFHVLIHESHINPGVRFSNGVEEVLCDAFADMQTTLFDKFKWKKLK